jgi:hypothetical protein
VLRDPGPYPNLKSAQVIAQNSVMPLGESDGEADSAVADEDAVDPASAEATRLRMRRMTRMALQNVGDELRLISRLSRDAESRRMQLQESELAVLSNAAQQTLTMKVKMATVAQAMACLLLKAFVLGAVATSQVLSLWWVVDNGVGYEGRYIRAVYMVTAQTIIGLLGAFVGCLLHVTGDRSPSIAVWALTIALPVAFLLGCLLHVGR